MEFYIQVHSVWSLFEVPRNSWRNGTQTFGKWELRAPLFLRMLWNCAPGEKNPQLPSLPGNLFIQVLKTSRSRVYIQMTADMIIKTGMRLYHEFSVWKDEELLITEKFDDKFDWLIDQSMDWLIECDGSIYWSISCSTDCWIDWLTGWSIEWLIDR